MKRSSPWPQILVGWLPVWILIVILMVAMHRPISVSLAAVVALRMIVTAALLGVGVAQLCARIPWPHPFRLRFIAIHLALALLFSGAWILFGSLVESVLHHAIILAVGPSVHAFIVLGVWLYAIVAGITYATLATAHAAEASEHAAHAQLAALRSQLHPHFLFNALHIVVQLIPQAPDQAIAAAEQVSDLLRTAIEEDRELVPLADEVAFVSRYLEIQRLRYGVRLKTDWTIPAEANDLLIPSFSLQALVENAVRHGAEPNMDPTTIAIVATVSTNSLALSVSDSGIGPADGWQQRGTGLKRLEQRLAALHGKRAKLDAHASSERGFIATLTIPKSQADE